MRYITNNISLKIKPHASPEKSIHKENRAKQEIILQIKMLLNFTTSPHQQALATFPWPA
jgi:hypothetical protein